MFELSNEFTFRKLISFPNARFVNENVSRKECDFTCWVSHRMARLLQEIT